MPSMSPVVLTDRETTPVNHTFTPDGIDSRGVTSFYERLGVPIGDPHLSISKRKTPAGNYKVVLKLAQPVVQTETINGIDSPKVIRTNFAEVNFTFNEATSSQERDNLVGMLQSALDKSSALIDATLVDLEGIY